MWNPAQIDKSSYYMFKALNCRLWFVHWLPGGVLEEAGAHVCVDSDTASYH